MRTRLICAFLPQISRACAVLRRYDFPPTGSVSGVHWISFRLTTTPGWSDGVTP